MLPDHRDGLRAPASRVSAIARPVSRSVRSTTKFGYTPSAITIATSGAIAARLTPSISRDSTAGPARPCMVPWKSRIM